MPGIYTEDLAVVGNADIRGDLKGAGAPGAAHPGGQGFVGWVCDPLHAFGSTGDLDNAGDVILVKVRAIRNALCATVTYEIHEAGTSLSNCFVGLYSTAGARLAVSADQSTAWQSAGVKNTDFSAAVEVSGGTNYYVAFLYGAATNHPNFKSAGATESSLSSTLLNVGTTAGSRRETIIAGSATSLPTSITVSSGTASVLGIWAGIRE